MKIGTKSILFGVHQFIIHPLFVALAWWQLYGVPWDPRLWVAFFVHDIGYWSKPNMDGPEGETHPFTGAKIMGRLFDYRDAHGMTVPLRPFYTRPIACLMDAIFGRIKHDVTWYCFTFYHSRFLAKKYGQRYSRLCVADKLAIAVTPDWLYMIQARLTGELDEYMKGAGARTPAGERTPREWRQDVKRYCRDWAYAHIDLRDDLWTGTKRDEARQHGSTTSI